MITYYPDKTTLREVLDTRISTSDLRRICKSNGLFILSQDKNDVLDIASKVFWGCDEINTFSEVIDDSKNYKKSVQWHLEGKNQGNPYNDFLGRMRARQREQTSDSAVMIENIFPKNSRGITEISVKHTRKQGGMVRLLQNSERYFTIQILERDANRTTINIIHNDNSDLKVATSLFNFDSDVDSYDVKQARLDVLIINNRVGLFDRFFQYDHLNWMREEILSIEVEAGEPDDTTEQREEEDEQDIVNGINSALIRGSGLRSNRFVQRCLDKGYYFTQTVVKFAHKTDPIKINLGMQFKDGAKFAELAILNSYEVEDSTDSRKVLPLEEQKDYLQYFNQCLYEIYTNLLIEQRS